LDLGLALETIGERESGTDKLEEAVAAYREALKEFTRDRVPLEWAYANHDLANALAALAERQKSSALMAEALACMRVAVEAYRQVGESYWLPIVLSRVTAMQAEPDELGLNFTEAAKRFADAARTLPAGDDYAAQRVAYLISEASALFRQGDEFGDNAALGSAIDRYRIILSGTPRERDPLAWATTQTNLGLALETLGERESGTDKLEEAVAVFREALKEFIRDRVPLEWAGRRWIWALRSRGLESGRAGRASWRRRSRPIARR